MKYNKKFYYIIKSKYISKLDLTFFLTSIEYDTLTVVTNQTNANCVLTLWWLACHVKAILPYKALWAPGRLGDQQKVNCRPVLSPH